MFQPQSHIISEVGLINILAYYDALKSHFISKVEK